MHETDYFYLAILTSHLDQIHFFFNEIRFLPFHKSCRPDQYESNDYKLGSVPRNLSCNNAILCYEVKLSQPGEAAYEGVHTFSVCSDITRITRRDVARFMIVRLVLIGSTTFMRVKILSSI
jgi:hypothetical protein